MQNKYQASNMNNNIVILKKTPKSSILIINTASLARSKFDFISFANIQSDIRHGFIVTNITMF